MHVVPASFLKNMLGKALVGYNVTHVTLGSTIPVLLFPAIIARLNQKNGFVVIVMTLKLHQILSNSLAPLNLNIIGLQN